MSDLALVREFVNRRDEASFRALYRRHQPRISGLARAITRNLGSAEVEDVVQETWVRAARDLARFEWRSSLSSWLCGILINVCRELARKDKRSGAGDDDLDRFEALVGRADPIDLLALTAALDSLPEGYRKVIALHDVGGFTHEEIASLLGIDAGTSKSQLSRARARLRDQLRETEGD